MIKCKKKRNFAEMKDAFIKLHLSVLVAGATGLFGRLISLQEIPLVWYRLLLAFVLFVPILYAQRALTRLPWKAALSIAAVGMLLGVHWIFFYASIRYSNVSIGVVCYALVGFYTALLDPIINKHAFAAREFLYSLLTLIGLALIFHFDVRYRFGIFLGVVSTAIAALFTICNKKVTNLYAYPTKTFLLYEMMGGLLILTCLVPFYKMATPQALLVPGLKDLGYLFVLASVCTIGQYMLQIAALRKIPPFTVNLTYNLEPIYSIILAMLIFNENKELNTAFYVGLSLIILSVVLQNWKTFVKH